MFDFLDYVMASAIFAQQVWRSKMFRPLEPLKLESHSAQRVLAEHGMSWHVLYTSVFSRSRLHGWIRWVDSKERSRFVSGSCRGDTQLRIASSAERKCCAIGTHYTACPRYIHLNVRTSIKFACLPENRSSDRANIHRGISGNTGIHNILSPSKHEPRLTPELWTGRSTSLKRVLVILFQIGVYQAERAL